MTQAALQRKLDSIESMLANNPLNWHNKPDTCKRFNVSPRTLDELALKHPEIMKHIGEGKVSKPMYNWNTILNRVYHSPVAQRA